VLFFRVFEIRPMKIFISYILARWNVWASGYTALERYNPFIALMRLQIEFGLWNCIHNYNIQKRLLCVGLNSSKVLSYLSLYSFLQPLFGERCFATLILLGR
jgi:hypothetical protein